MDEVNVPKFTFDDDELAKIRAKLEVDEVPEPGVIIPMPVQPPRRKRGRPRKHPVSETGTTVKALQEAEPEPVKVNVPPAKLTKRQESEVSERIANMLMASTGLASQMKPYLAMTEEEAKSISEPLSAYLIRNEDTIGVAQQI